MRDEAPTVLLILAAYILWGLSTTLFAQAWLPIGIVGVALSAALHASLTHEVLHGHPFRNRHLNAALVFPALSLAVPYMRFRDTHIAHHRDETLTDPYDDPESNFWDPVVLARQPRWMRALLRVNNTLLGRILIGPLIGQIAFMAGDWRRRDGRVALGWLWHIPALGLVAWWVAAVASMPVWAFLLGSYLGMSILKIRTFLEHRAEADADRRTVIIEDRGLLAFLFLNNNLHVVHHRNPKLSWHRLPAAYRAEADRYRALNGGYVYPSYGAVFRRYFVRAKDPVAHPLWSRD